MKSFFYTFLILFFSAGLSYSQDANCPCPKFPKWQRLMDKQKYKEASELAEDITEIKTGGPIGENVDYDKFRDKYGKTNCYNWYKDEAYFRLGHGDWIRNHNIYNKQNEPKAAYRYRYFFIEYGKRLFAVDKIDDALYELEFAWKVSSELEMEKCSEDELDNNQVMFQLAELLGDVYTKNKDFENALKYYKFYDSNKYSSDISSKIAFAKENLGK
jgi:hypothetical protein